MSDSGTQSESVENFLKAVFTMAQSGARVSTNTLSEMLNKTAPSVTDMAQRLEVAGLIDYQKYRGVTLTDHGREIALKIIRRHRLIELYLTRELGYALHEVHEEAERLEHAVSERFVEAISRKLGEPIFDPHGDPIPSPDGRLIERDLVALTHLPPGKPGVIAQIKTSDPHMIRHLLERGMTLEAEVTLLAIDPFEGPVRIVTHGKEQAIGYSVAACVLVQVAS